MKLAAMVVAMVMLPIAAHAEEVAPPAYDPDTHLHWEGGVGMLVGSFPVGPFDGVGVGMHFDAGIRLNRLALFAEYDMLSLSSDGTTSSSYGGATYEAAGASAPVINYDNLSGSEHRFAFNARYSIGKLGGHDFPMRGDFWVEAGAGRQVISWDGGGELTRPDVTVGLGGEMSGRWGDHQEHHAGYYFALRMSVAHRPGASDVGPATCAGPCDEPTRPDDLDRSYMFDFGIVFGN